MSGSGKGLLGLWLYHSGDHEWAVKEGSPLHRVKSVEVSDEIFMNDRGKLNTKSICLNNLKETKSIEKTPTDKTSLIFTINNQVGGLARVLQVFQELGINVLFIEFQQYSQGKEEVINYIFMLKLFSIIKFFT